MKKKALQKSLKVPGVGAGLLWELLQEECRMGLVPGNLLCLPENTPSCEKKLFKAHSLGNGVASVSFSPDGKYIAFTVKKDFEEDIFIYHIGSKKLTNYTQTGVTETSPFWGPEGKYLYFISNRTRPSYPFGLQDGRVFRIPLTRMETDFKSDKLAAVFPGVNKCLVTSLPSSVSK